MNWPDVTENNQHRATSCGARYGVKQRTFGLLAFASIVMLCAWPRSGITSPIPPMLDTQALVVGLSTHIDRTGTDYHRALTLVQEAGADSVRVDATWSRVEKERGVLSIPDRWRNILDIADARHIKVLLILDYGNQWYERSAKPSTPAARKAFVRYAAFVASQLRGKVYGYEIWNEWDDTAGHTAAGSASDYVKLLKVVYPALKVADPSALILGGSVTSRAIDDGYLAKLVELGALHYMDGLSLHPYVQCAKGSTVASWKSWMTTIEQHLSTLAHHTVPVYVTEVGWPSSITQCGVALPVQAMRAHNVVLAAASLGFVRGIWWYDLRDDGISMANAQDQFGLVANEWSPKPAFSAFKSAADAVGRQMRSR